MTDLCPCAHTVTPRRDAGRKVATARVIADPDCERCGGTGLIERPQRVTQPAYHQRQETDHDDD